MPALSIHRLPQARSSRAAIVGATRAFDAAFITINVVPMTERISKALAALHQSETDAAQPDAGEAV